MAEDVLVSQKPVRTLPHSVVRSDMEQGLWSIPVSAHQRILDLADGDTRIHITKAFSTFRHSARLRTLDLSFKVVSPVIFGAEQETKVLQASHARFSPALSSLSEAWHICASLHVLDLTGASITSETLHRILATCTQLAYVILDGMLVDENVFKFEKPLVRLKVLSFMNGSGLTDVNVAHAMARSLPNVENLDISNTDITSEGLFVLMSSVNPLLEILAVADLGWRFDLPHLEALANRCPDLLMLDISSTRAARLVDVCQYVKFHRLEELMVNLSDPILGPVPAEGLLQMDQLPSLRRLYFYRRIELSELTRLAPWNLRFKCMRGLFRKSGSCASKVCRRLIEREDKLDYPRDQTSNQEFFGGSHPL